jgi:hypothetical protein
LVRTDFMPRYDNSFHDRYCDRHQPAAVIFG